MFNHLSKMSFFVSFSILSAFVCAATIPGSVWETTECKTCPYSLCTNAKIYNARDNPNTTFACWTRGTEIYNDTYVIV